MNAYIKRFLLVGILMLSLAGCRQLGAQIASQVFVPGVNANPPAQLDNALVVPADWKAFQQGDFNFYYPASWALNSTTKTRIVFDGQNGEVFQLAIGNTQCGVGQGDVPLEDVVSCLATSGASVVSQVAQAYITSQDIRIVQGHVVYAFSYGVISVIDGSSSRQFFTTSALPGGKMLIGLYQANLLGPQTREDLLMVMGSFHQGTAQVALVTPTPAFTPTPRPVVTLPEITVAVNATIQPVIVPQDWQEDVCNGCAITFFRPPAWKQLQDQADHVLYQESNGNLVLIGVSPSACDLTDAALHQEALACLTDEKASQVPANADYAVISSGQTTSDAGDLFWIAYTSSTPDNSQVVYGLDIYRLLPDHRLLTVQFASTNSMPSDGESANLYLLAADVRLGAADRITPTPTPVPTRGSVNATATPSWQGPVQSVMDTAGWLK